MTESSGRRRQRKWDVPAEDVDRNENSGTSDAARKARERAAALAAKLAAEGKLAQGVAPPPVIAPAAILQSHKTSTAPISTTTTLEIADPEIKKLDNGGYMAELEINDLPARVNLTKKNVQDKISQQSGAAIATKGRYLPIEEKYLLKEQGERPLYLNIQGPIQAKVQVALHMLKDVIRNFGKPEQPGHLNGSQNATLNYVQDKIFVGLDFAPPEYNIKEKLEGQNGSFFQHIISQTGAKVHLRGKGSGYIEQNSGRESFEALHIYISHPRQEGLQSAKSLCENLLQTVHIDFKNWDQTNRQRPLYAAQGYGQQGQLSFQPPTIYPGYNVPPPNYNQTGNLPAQNMPPHPGYSQPPASSYGLPNYPPPRFQNEPPSTYRPPYQPPYSQTQPQNLPSQLPTSQGYHPHSENHLPHGFAPPQQHLEPQFQSSEKSNNAAPEAPKRERRKRRFTEDPELIRKASEPTKESTSHSLDSNTKFRSSGASPAEPSRDHHRPESHSTRFEGIANVSSFSPPRGSASSKPGREEFKAPSGLLAVSAKKGKKKKNELSKNPLSSLIAYDDSDSDEE